MLMLKTIFAVAMAALTLAVGSVGDVAGQGQTIENRLHAADEEFRAAEEANWHLYAPRIFADAQKKLNDARERFERGGKIESIESALAEAQQKLAEAGEFADIGALVLADAITARSDALAAEAPTHAPEEWERAKETLYDAGRNVERGNNNDARRDAKQAEERFRAAELQAIRVDLLGGARVAEEAARSAGADEKAPRTFAEATKLLSDAEKTLAGDRYQRAQAKEQARAATTAFRHATHIASLVDRVQADRPQELESLQLWHEGVVAAVADVVNVPVDFSDGIEAAGDALLGGVTSLEEDRDNLREELTAANERIARLETELAQLEEKEQSASATVREERKRREDLRSLRDLFTADQAVVIQEGEDLICRVYGMSFAPGSAVIRPDDFSLLTKIQSALRIFPTAKVTVEGHTDSVGDADLNHRLSLQRAEAVRSYIVANMPGDADRITAIGYGESVPLASNDTADGRAKNRRIDIRLSYLYRSR